MRLWNGFPALFHLEGSVMLTAEDSISVEFVTDRLLRFVPSGNVPNISIASGLVMGSGSPLYPQVVPESSLHW